MVGSGLNSIFQLKSHFEINKRSLLSILALSFIFLIIVKRDVPSAINLTLNFNSFGKSLIKIRKRSGPNIEPWGTPAKIGFHEECWPFKITL